MRTTVHLFLLFILFTSSLGYSSPQLPERIRETFQKVVQSAVKKDYAGALDIASAARTSDLEPMEAGILANLMITQLTNLKRWSEAKALSLEFLNEDDFILPLGFFLFGQKVGVTTVVEKLAESESPEDIVAYAGEVLRRQPDWRAANDHYLASFWTVLGNSQFKVGNLAGAVLSWERAKACWDSKTELWKDVEPDKYAKYKGLDRFNPLELNVSAKLFTAYKKLDQSEKASAILKSWRAQVEVLENIDKEKSTSGAELFRRSLKEKIKEASAVMGMADSLTCEEYLQPKIKGSLF